jgi:pyruvate dehydrogenase E1 component
MVAAPAEEDSTTKQPSRSFRDRVQHPGLRRREPSPTAVPSPTRTARRSATWCERRIALGGYLPQRRRYARRRSQFRRSTAVQAAAARAADGREISTTMAFVRMLDDAAQGPADRQHIVPIVPDEARTFGMEGLFRQVGIYSSVGQLYTPQDADQLMSYREDKKGQILEEGINEAGAMCSWMAAGTAYANHGINMVPFYIFYSMFGFQRVGDFIWAAGDLQTRGFLLGATAGRTTLAGEGLQHQDGHSQLLASTVPNCRSYDPTFAYELAVIIHDGLRRMFVDGEHGVLLRHGDERELRHAGDARGRRAGHPEGPLSVCDLLRGGRRGRRTAGHAARFGHHPARGDRRRRAARQRLRGAQ